MVVKPKSYWIDCGEFDGNDEVDGENPSSEGKKLKIELNDSATIYRQHFVNSEHSNLIAYDEAKNPVLISMKPESIANKEYTRVLLRQTSGTMHEILPRFSTETNATPKQISALLSDRLKVQKFEAVVYPMASNLITEYDEYHLIMNFKFGVLYQKFGQVFEEEVFSNNETSPDFKEFLSLLGNKIELKNHKGYRGGLDVQNGQTGDSTIYEVFENREIIFHVSTMLPFSKNDQQQLQRKRHIGNDIVAIVFQEENTPFSPDMIASHFLHAFIVIQPYKRTAYRCAVVCRQGVPFFGPPLPKNGIISKKSLKKFLLTKLINAENACYKAEKFANLEHRTRSSLLSNLVEDLRTKTNSFLGVEATVEPEVHSGSNRFIETVRKAFISRVKSQSTADSSGVKGQHLSGNVSN
jgi:RAP1 GTPase activating protein 1